MDDDCVITNLINVDEGFDDNLKCKGKNNQLIVHE